MSLDADLLRLQRSLPDDFPTPVDWPAARAANKARAESFVAAGALTWVKTIEEHRIGKRAGAAGVRVYRPDGAPSMTVIYFHGGGWTVGDLDTADPAVRKICHHLGAIVVSCGYRVAPEQPFPAAYDDALAAARWVLSHIVELGGDPERVVIAGDSAGGNLAAAVTIALRDEARQAVGRPAAALPALRAQLLLYPVVDLRGGARKAGSYLADRDPGLRTAVMEACMDAYVQRATAADWRVSPLASADFSDLPPALVVVLGVDPLRDQAVMYAASLRKAGVPCELIEFPHLTHGFTYIAGLVPAAGRAFDEVLTRFELLCQNAPPHGK
jgi:acetyl esterase